LADPASYGENKIKPGHTHTNKQRERERERERERSLKAAAREEYHQGWRETGSTGTREPSRGQPCNYQRSWRAPRLQDGATWSGLPGPVGGIRAATWWGRQALTHLLRRAAHPYPTPRHRCYVAQGSDGAGPLFALTLHAGSRLPRAPGKKLPSIPCSLLPRRGTCSGITCLVTFLFFFRRGQDF